MLRVIELILRLMIKALLSYPILSIKIKKRRVVKICYLALYQVSTTLIGAKVENQEDKRVEKIKDIRRIRNKKESRVVKDIRNKYKVSQRTMNKFNQTCSIQINNLALLKIQ